MPKAQPKRAYIARETAGRMRSARMARGFSLDDLMTFAPSDDMHQAVSNTQSSYPDAK